MLMIFRGTRTSQGGSPWPDKAVIYDIRHTRFTFSNV